MLSIWSFLLASCSGLRLASGDLREQFNPPKATVGTVEVRVLFTGNSRYVALSNRKLSAAEHHDAQISRPVMVNIRWSQSEESQLVESLPAGNSIELIATNLSRSTNEVFSRAIGALVALAALPFGLPVDFLKVFSLALDKCVGTDL